MTLRLIARAAALLTAGASVARCVARALQAVAERDGPGFADAAARALTTATAVALRPLDPELQQAAVATVDRLPRVDAPGDVPWRPVAVVMPETEV